MTETNPKSWGIQYLGSMRHQQELSARGNLLRCLRCHIELNPSDEKKWLQLVGFSSGHNTPPSVIDGDVGVIIEACPFCSVNYYMHISQEGLEIVKKNINWPS
jgi:hypothetical protein